MKDKLLKALDGQCISTGPQRYSFTERLLTGDVKATFNQADLNIGIRANDNFNKVLLELTKHAFAAYAFYEQKRYFHRHQVKPRSMKLSSFISRFQELNAYLVLFYPDTEGQETASLPTDEIMGTIYNSMPTTWENEIIEQDFYYGSSTIIEMTDFFETTVENLKVNENKKKYSSIAKDKEEEKESPQEKEKSRL